MRISTLSHRNTGGTELGVVFASTEGVNASAFDECLAMLVEKAEAMGATALLGLQVVQSQFQWNPRTSLVATAYKGVDLSEGRGSPPQASEEAASRSTAPASPPDGPPFT
jgi:hypothetical protein